MDRNLHTSTVTALEQTVVFPANFVEANFSGGSLRVWTGLRNITFNGNTYLAAGNLLGIGKIDETTDLEATGVRVTLSGISSTLISKILGELTRNRTLNIWFATLDVNDNIVGEATQIFSGYMDIPSIEDSGQVSLISLSAESIVIDFNRVRPDVYTDEFQRTIDATDDSLEYLADLANKSNGFRWG